MNSLFSLSMNRYLCEPDSLILTNTTAYYFAETLASISLYTLPILALVDNSLTLLVILTNPQLNCSSFSVYVKSLAVSDTLVLLFKILSYLNKTSKSFYFSSLCTMLIFCGEVSVLLSVWIIVFITIERALVVLYPLYKTKYISQFRARFIILLLLTLIMIFSARILIIPIDTSIESKFRCYPESSWYTYRNINSTITEFGYCYIPLIIVVIGNCLTACKVKQAVIRRQDILTNHSYRQNYQTNSNENQLMFMLLVVTLMFIIYFVPFTIIKVISRLGLPFNYCFTQKSFEIYIIIRSLSEFLKDLNFCTNFIIYCVSGRPFRHAFFSLFRIGNHKSLNSSQNISTTKNRGNRLLKANSDQKSRLCGKNTMIQSQF